MSLTVGTGRGLFRVSHLERMASRKQVFWAVDQAEISLAGAWDFCSSHASHASARPSHSEDRVLSKSGVSGNPGL